MTRRNQALAIDAMLRSAAMTPADQVELVLRFLLVDLELIGAEEQQAWSNDLNGLPIRPLDVPSYGLRMEWLRSYGALDAGGLALLQARLRAGVCAVVEREPWTLPLPVRLTVLPDRGRCVLQEEYTAVPAIILAVAQLVVAHRARIRKCQHDGCGVIFLARKRQTFCTPQHGQATRDQRKASVLRGERAPFLPATTQHDVERKPLQAIGDVTRSQAGRGRR